MPPTVSVLVVAWHSRSDIFDCLSSAITQADNVVLVDNASADGTVEFVRARFPTVTTVGNASNVGFAAAVNQAARLATGDFLLLLNPDTQLRSGALAALTAALERDAGLAAVGGHLVDASDTTQVGFTVRRFPTIGSLAADLLLLDEIWPTNPWTRRYRALDLDYAHAQDVEQPAAACLLVRRSVFEALGGLDTGFGPAWFEDVDFCRRLTAAGWRIGFVPDARVVHRGGSSLGSLSRAAFLELWYRNMRRYVRRHHGRIAEMSLRGLIVAGMMLRVFASLCRGNLSGAKVFGRVIRSILVPGPTTS
jgi:GT2 family glycosyltransferase